MNTDSSKFIYKTADNLNQPNANDPWVVSDGGSGYYYCWSGSGVYVAHLKDLSRVPQYRALGNCVWTPPQGTVYSHELWAPELHFIDGRWYIYVAADDGRNENHRMYVLACKGEDPTGEFEFVGKIADDSDKWAIDGTVLTLGGEHYFIWSGWEGDENVCQKLYISHMSSPTSIDSPRVCISTPELDWELKGGMALINEGPFALTTGDSVRVIYSASGSWCDDYCLGMLTLIGSDPLDPTAWVKYPEPILYRSEGNYGPGHCSIAPAIDGSLWIFYHANLVSGSGWAGRSLRMHPITNADGSLRIGPAPAPDASIRIPVPSSEDA